MVKDLVMEPKTRNLQDDAANDIPHITTPEEAMHHLSTVLAYLQEHLPDSTDHIKTLSSIRCFLSVIAEETKTQRKLNHLYNNSSKDVTPGREMVGSPVTKEDIIHHVVDHKVEVEDENRAVNTLPSCLSIGRSLVQPGSVGVFSNALLTDSVYFGPYRGETVENLEDCITTSWIWQTVGSDGKIYYVDGHNSSKANWMRYVHCTSAEKSHNLQAIQCDGEIFYKVTRTITPGTELIVCYQYSCDDSSNTAVVGGSGVAKNSLREKGITSNSSDTFSEVVHAASDAKLERADGGRLKTNRVRHHAKREYDCFSARSGKFRCKSCHKEFTIFSQFRYHERQHTGEKPYQCSDCGRCFRVTGHLRVHQLTHTNNKPYSCKFCSRRFTQSSNLTRHLRIHTGEKPHQCLYCGKRFADATTFKCHQRIHTGERPYKCKVCGQGFISSSRRKTHTLCHSQFKPERLPQKSLITKT